MSDADVVRKVECGVAQHRGLQHLPAMRVSRSFFVLLLLVIAPAMFAATFTVTIKAVDAEKKVVPNAEVALFWNLKDATTLAGKADAVTDESGKAVLQVDDWNEKRAV